MGHENQRPKIELGRAFMPVLITNIFDDYSIKNERAGMETPFFNYKSMRIFSDGQGQLTPQSVVRSAEIRSRPGFFCMSLLPASITRGP